MACTPYSYYLGAPYTEKNSSFLLDFFQKIHPIRNENSSFQVPKLDNLTNSKRQVVDFWNSSFCMWSIF